MIARIPKVIAHRGSSYSRPENTAAAFDQALADHCDGIELDLQITRDDQVVVFHDKTLSMLGLKHRRIGQYTREELRDLDVGSWFSSVFADQRVLDLDQVLDAYGTRTDLLLEIKPVGELKSPERARRLAEVVADRVAQHSGMHEIFLLSFSQPALDVVAERNEALRRVRNVEFHDELKALKAGQLERLHAVCVDIRNFTRKQVEKVHAANRALFTYTADSPRHLRTALDLGVEAVITNQPSRTRRILEGFRAADG